MTAGATLLVVDDDVTNRQILQAMLGGGSYRFLSADSGAEALKMLAEHEIDLVLLDVMMPGLDGFETCRRIRGDAAIADVPVVMVTALDQRDARLCGINVGADDFISKPLDRDELRARVGSITRLNRYRRLVQQTKRVNYLECYDPLTGLPNRSVFIERLNARLQRSEGGQSSVVMCIGLDGFRVINDAFGLDGGDQLLFQISRRLADSLQTGEVLARLDGRFLLLANGGPNPRQQALALAERLQATLSESLYPVGGQEVGMTASVGITLAPHDAADAETLLANAGAALGQALDEGGGRQKFFAETMSENALSLLSVANRFRQALQQGALTMHYQPRFALADGRCCGLDAQLFWRGDELDLPVSERDLRAAYDAGLGVAINQWAVRRLCEQMAVWQERGLTLPTVSFGLSPALLQHAELIEMLGGVRDAVGSAGLEVSLPESALKTVPHDMLLLILEQLQALGMSVIVDQFGSGVMSLSRLSRLPLDGFVINAAIVRELNRSVSDGAVAKSIVGLAHGLGRRALAKGVGSDAQRELLLAWGCDEVQGPLFDQPQTADAIAKRWADRGRRDPATLTAVS